MIYLVIQGKIRDGADELYEEYLRSVTSLMKEYGVEVELVGSGLESKYTTETHAQNAILKMADLETLNRFLGDDRYLSIKKKYRDRAYEYLRLSVFEARPPRQFD